MKTGFFIFLCLLCFVGLPGYAQIENEERIEFELREGYSDHRLARFGELGIVMYSRESGSRNFMSTWKLEHFDTKLKADKEAEISVPANQMLDEAFENDKNLYLFFKSARGQYSLFIISASTLEVKKHEGDFPPKTRLYDLKIQGDMAYFDAVIKKNPALISINTKTGKRGITALTVPKFKSKFLSVDDIQTVEKTDEVFVYIKAFSRRRSGLYIFRLDKDGNKLDMFNFADGLDKKISSVTASNTGPDEYLMTGTYSSVSSMYSEGLYIAKVKNGKREFIEFYNFLDFEEFLNYLPERRQEKIERKKARKKERGKEMTINYQIASHDILTIDGNYVFIGEAFYPTYRSEPYTTVGPNGVPITHYRTVFDGNQYTHATVAAFSPSGKKLWDKTFEMWPSYKPFYRKKFITTSREGRNIDMLFINRVKIVSMSVTPKGDIAKKHEVEMLETGNEEDVVKRSYANMEYWYGNHFLAFGNQKIKNKEGELFNKKRRVFFINKISYK